MRVFHSKRAVALVLAFVLAFAGPAAAVAETITTGAAGTSYYEYHNLSGGVWSDLLTPPHWTGSGNVAFCLEQTADYPLGETYGVFNPLSVFSTRTRNGLQAITFYGYPYSTGGFSAVQARYATANAIRAWLSESAGVGYAFMNLSGYDPNNSATWTNVRPVSSSYNALFRWTLSLVAYARAQQYPAHAVTSSPNPVTLVADPPYAHLVGSTTVVFNNLNGSYTYSVPAGVTVTGYTGSNGDVLTLSVPLTPEWLGQTVTLTLTGTDSRVPANLYWYSPSYNSSLQRFLVPTSLAFAPAAVGLITVGTGEGAIDLRKTDELDGSAVAGALFQLNWGTIEVAQGTTDASGQLLFDEIAPGTYTIFELAAPAGYLLDPTVHTVVVPDGPAVLLRLTNEPAMRPVEVIKTGEAGEALAGAVFEVRDSGGALMDTLTTDATGRARSIPLDFGNYTLVEIVAPVGHVLDPTPHPFTTARTSPAVVVVALDNERITGRVRIIKDSDGVAGALLEGATFEVFADDGSTVPVCELVTDENGEATSDLLEYGGYYAVETVAPIGHVLDPTPHPFVIHEQDELVTLEITDPIIRGRVHIIKRSAGVDNPGLEGAVYQVFRSADASPAASFEPTVTLGPVCELVTDENGEATSDLLEYGVYYAVETIAPVGHGLDESHRYFEVREDDAEILFELEDSLLKIHHGGVQVRYRNVWDGTEIAHAWGYNAEVGSAYLPWLAVLNSPGYTTRDPYLPWTAPGATAAQAAGRPIDGFIYVSADYPAETELIDGKLTVTYWYKRTIDGSWSLVGTGDDGLSTLTPQVRETFGLLSDSELYARLQDAKTVNPDVVGYLSVPGTDLHEPVVQTTDNLTYLSTGALGAPDPRGAIMMDYRSDRYVGSQSRMTVLHGHNMRDDSMFGLLASYGDPDFWSAHPFIQYIDAAGRGGTWRVYSARLSDGADDVFTFPTSVSYAERAQAYAHSSVLDPGFLPDPDGRTLTLSTCAYHVEDGKFLVHAQLVE
ncbi:MAG: SpaA isopeptide-forming pilin-related protein [Coriobacteriia bacterium]|nr:SpaA isopeptide-forming pilin-related protein [Coriobacteriia bacterium]